MSPSPDQRVHLVSTADQHRLALTELLGGPSSGGGPCFLMIHGFSQDRRAFLGGPLAGVLLARGARVFAGELRGHGLSDEGRPRTWTLEAHLDLDLPVLIARALELARVDRVHLFGHSLGGMLGYVLAARGAPVASLATFAAPVSLGRGRPLVRLAAGVVGAGVELLGAEQFPVDLLLRALAPLLTVTESRHVRRRIQRFLGLANPRGADVAAIGALLREATPESSQVFLELARMALRGRTVIGGMELREAARRAACPVLAVVGTHDVFAPRASVAALNDPGAMGPRMILELPDALHVDLTLGPDIAGVEDTLWNFLVRA